MSAVFYSQHNPERPITLVNVQTIGASCGRFSTHEAAEEYLRGQGYAESDFWRDGNSVMFNGGINC